MSGRDHLALVAGLNLVCLGLNILALKHILPSYFPTLNIVNCQPFAANVAWHKFILTQPVYRRGRIIAYRDCASFVEAVRSRDNFVRLVRTGGYQNSSRLRMDYIPNWVLVEISFRVGLLVGQQRWDRPFPYHALSPSSKYWIIRWTDRINRAQVLSNSCFYLLFFPYFQTAVFPWAYEIAPPPGEGSYGVQVRA